MNLLKENNPEARLVNVVDCPMGCGKTSAMTNYVNAMPEDEKVIYVTPYCDEAERVSLACRQAQMRAVEKDAYDGKKLTDLKRGVLRGENLACTHELLGRFDEEALGAIRGQNYTLVIDEAYTVIQVANNSAAKSSLSYMVEKGTVVIDEETGHITFANEHEAATCPHYRDKVDTHVHSGNAYLIGDKVLVLQFPIKILDAFRRIIIMTYMFDAQVISYYLSNSGYQFNYVGARKTDLGAFELCLPEESDGFRYNVSEKIHIYDGKKLNSIGESLTRRGKEPLSSSWFKSNRNNDKAVGQLGRNFHNLQQNIWSCSAKDFMWTCFAESGRIDKKIAKANKNIAKDYVPCNARAENKYSNRHYLAFGVNWCGNPNLCNYFRFKGVTFDEDKWALSMMLQWIWRSAIRNGEEIYIYVPSLKMRTLLTDWIKSVSEGGGAVGC